MSGTRFGGPVVPLVSISTATPGLPRRPRPRGRVTPLTSTAPSVSLDEPPHRRRERVEVRALAGDGADAERLEVGAHPLRRRARGSR